MVLGLLYADEHLISTTVRKLPKKLRLSWLYNSCICNFTLLLILRMTMLFGVTVIFLITINFPLFTKMWSCLTFVCLN